MDHKKIARLLKLAGGMAVAGIVFVFYLSTPLRISLNPSPEHPLMLMGCKAATGIPYLLALRLYFKICGNIGRNNSFSNENVRCLNGIAKILSISALLWLIALAANCLKLFSGDLPEKILLTIYILAMLASLALALAAKMLAYLVNRAVDLQQDSDLTI